MISVKGRMLIFFKNEISKEVSRVNLEKKTDKKVSTFCYSNKLMSETNLATDCKFTVYWRRYILYDYSHEYKKLQKRDVDYTIDYEDKMHEVYMMDRISKRINELLSEEYFMTPKMMLDMMRVK